MAPESRSPRRIRRRVRRRREGRGRRGSAGPVGRAGLVNSCYGQLQQGRGLWFRRRLAVEQGIDQEIKQLAQLDRLDFVGNGLGPSAELVDQLVRFAKYAGPLEALPDTIHDSAGLGVDCLGRLASLAQTVGGALALPD